MNLQTALAHESTKINRSLERNLSASDGIRLVAGKGDWAAFQVLLLGDEDFTLTVGDSPAFSSLGPLTNVRLQVKYSGGKAFPTSLNIVGFIDDDDGTLKSDILLKNEALHVGKGEIQPVWVEIQIPPDADAGVYQGEVQIFLHSMFEDEKVTSTLKFELDIKNVVMPAPREYTFHLDLWQHLSNIARKHEVHLWSDEHFAIIEEYVKSLAALGQKAVTVIASEIPWSGQGCMLAKDYPSDLFEYSMIRVEKDRSGVFHYDYSVMERYIKLCFQYGIDREIEVFGLTNIWVIPEEGFEALAPDYPDAIRIRYLDHSDGCYKYMKSGKEIREYIRALEQYFIQRNWIDRVLIVADEPADVALYRQRLDLLKELAPSFRFKTAINHVEFIDAFKEQVQDFVPALQCACEEWELLKKLKNMVEGRILWYVCCNPNYPNTFIGSPLVESQLIGYFTTYTGLDGFLRWNYTVWPEKPRERLSYKYPNWKSGDTNFVYPGYDGKPLLSLRYKNLKRGIDAFELIQILKRVAPNAREVLERVWSLIFRTRRAEDFHPQSGKEPKDLYSLDYADYQNARQILLEEIEKSMENR